jgi:uncharacterized protein YndB with AHSA1/START domain
MNDMSENKINLRVSRRLHSTPQRVFDAWLDTDAIAQWMFGPTVRDERVVSLELDARVGGAFVFRVERDGTIIEHIGQYLAIEPPHRLTFTWRARIVGDETNDASVVDIDIIALDIGCELTLTHRMSSEWAEYTERTQKGWMQMLDVLASTIAPDAINDDDGDRLDADTIRFDRSLPGPIERVWTYLTDSDKRALWLAEGPMDLVPDGEIELRFHNADLARDCGIVDDRAPEHYREYENSGQMFGRILVCEPPHRLSFTWTDLPGERDEDDSVVDIVLREENDRVRMTLTHRRLQPHELLSVAAGWHTHLGILLDRLHARTARPFWRTHTALEAKYAEKIGFDD